MGELSDERGAVSHTDRPPRDRALDADRRAREELLIRGLDDWVHLYEIHSQVMHDNPGAALEAVQHETLEMIRSLVSDGLCDVGDLSGPDGGFAPWETPLEDSIARIADCYVRQFEDDSAWIWVFWLRLTDNGRQVAQALVTPRPDDLSATAGRSTETDSRP